MSDSMPKPDAPNIERKLAKARQDVRAMIVAQLRPDISPEQRAIYRELEGAARREVRRALWANAQAPKPSPQEMLERALNVLADPLAPDEVKQAAKRVKDNVEVAIGLRDAAARKRARRG